MSRDETILREVGAVRKGRGQRPCKIKVCYTDGGSIVLRTEDASGVPPIVALLTPESADELGKAFLEASRRLREQE